MKYIGIDIGKNTGLAVWDEAHQRLELLSTVLIHQAMEMVLEYHSLGTIKVFIEDARLRTWYGDSGREKLMGAGSIRRDATIWQDFLEDKGIPYRLVAPKDNVTKLNAKQFQRLTGWNSRSTEHSRDAAGLVCPLLRIYKI